MRNAIRHLIEKLVDLRDRFDGEKERTQLLALQLRECRSRIVRMKEEIDDLTAAIDDLETLK